MIGKIRWLSTCVILISSYHLRPLQTNLCNPLCVHDWEKKLDVNLSNSYLDQLTFTFLKHGLDFALSPRVIPHVDFLIEIESIVCSLPTNSIDLVRQECVVDLRHAKPPKANSPKVEHMAFNHFLSNNDVVIIKEDKGNVTVYEQARL